MIQFVFQFCFSVQQELQKPDLRYNIQRTIITEESNSCGAIYFRDSHQLHKATAKRGLQNHFSWGIEGNGTGKEYTKQYRHRSVTL